MIRARTLIASAAVFWAQALWAGPLEEAQSYFQKKDYKASVIEAKNALQQDPSNIQARLLLGRAYLALYKGAEAEKEFLRVRQLGGPADQWKPGLARALFYQGKNKALLDQLPLDPALSPEAYADLAALRADAHLALGQPDQAREELEKGKARLADHPQLRLSEARLYLARKDEPAARRILESLVQSHPDNAEAHAMLGAIAKSAGERAVAAEHFAAAARLDPNNLSARIGLATLAIADKDYAQARQEIERVLKQVPGHLFATYLSGLVDLQEGRLDEADRKMDFVLQNAPDYQPAVFVKGTILLNQKKYEQADRYLTLYLQSHPDNAQVAEWVAYARTRTGDYQGALKVLERFADGKRASTYVLRGIAHMGLKQFDQASADLEKALEMAPGSTVAQQELALARLNLGDLEAARKIFEETGRMGELLFVAHMQKKDYQKAEAVAHRLIREKPDNPVYHNMLGLALLGEQKTDAAIRAFEAAVHADPQYLTARFNLARTYDLMGRLDEARRQYAEVNKIKPSAAAYVGLANVAMKAGQDEAAEGHLKKAMEIDPGAARFLAKFYLRRGRPDEAIALLDKQDDPGSVTLLVDAYRQAGRLDEALAAARRLPEGTQKDLLLARLHLAKGDRQAAERAYERILERDEAQVVALAESARLALADGDEATFRQRLQRLERLPGTDALVQELRGDQALAKGDHAAAMEHYEALIRKGLVSPLLWRKYDQAAMRGKALARAEKAYVAYLQSHPDDRVTRRRYAILLQHEGENEAAAREYEQVLAAGDDPVALNNLAWIRIEAGDRRGLELARKAFDLAPDNPGVVDTYAWAQIRLGDADKGVTLLKSWLPKTRNPAQLNEMKYHLAYGLIRTGRSDEAQRYLDELAQAGEKDRVDRLEALKRQLGGRLPGVQACCA